MYHQITIEEALQQLQQQEQQKETVFCRRCGRKLKSVKAKQLGFGPSCYKKHIAGTVNSNRKRLFVVEQEEK